MKKILQYIFKPQARRDVIEIAVYISKENIKFAGHFLKALEGTCKNIVLFPEIGSLRRYKHPALKNIRMLPVNKFDNYLIFYQLTGKKVEIIRILHGARDILSLFLE